MVVIDLQSGHMGTLSCDVRETLITHCVTDFTYRSLNPTSPSKANHNVSLHDPLSRRGAQSPRRKCVALAGRGPTTPETCCPSRERAHLVMAAAAHRCLAGDVTSRLQAAAHPSTHRPRSTCAGWSALTARPPPMPRRRQTVGSRRPVHASTADSLPTLGWLRGFSTCGNPQLNIYGKRWP